MYYNMDNYITNIYLKYIYLGMKKTNWQNQQQTSKPANNTNKKLLLKKKKKPEIGGNVPMAGSMMHNSKYYLYCNAMIRLLLSLLVHRSFLKSIQITLYSTYYIRPPRRRRFLLSRCPG